MGGITEEQMEAAAAAISRLTGRRGEDRTEAIRVLKAMDHGGSYAADRARGQLAVLDGGYEVSEDGLGRWVKEWLEGAESARVGCQTEACPSCKKDRLPRTRKLLCLLSVNPDVLSEEQFEQALKDTQKGGQEAYLARGKIRAHNEALRICVQRLSKVHIYKYPARPKR